MPTCLTSRPAPTPSSSLLLAALAVASFTPEGVLAQEDPQRPTRVPTTIGQGEPFTHPPSEPAPQEPGVASTGGEASAKVLSIADQLRAGLKKVKNAQCTFHKEEWKNGGPLEPSVAILKHSSAGEVYLSFQKGANEGREILFRPGKNDDKLLVTNPIFNLSLEPDSYLAMRTNRHTVRNAGLHFIARRILKDHTRLKELPPDAVRYKDLGRKKIGRDWASCYEADADRKRFPELYAEKTEICVADRFGLPIDVRVWQFEDGKEREVGHYRYENCELNKLSDKDFDPDNEAYGF